MILDAYRDFPVEPTDSTRKLMRCYTLANELESEGFDGKDCFPLVKREYDEVQVKTENEMAEVKKRVIDIIEGRRLTETRVQVQLTIASVLDK